MPGWVLSIIIQLVIKWGAPWLIHAIMAYPKLPQEVRDVLQKLLDALGDPKASNSAAKKTALSELKDCLGVACDIALKE